MKLKYKILWIEDNPKAIRSDKNKIIEYINSLGFECSDNIDIITIKSVESFEKEISYENTSDYDLLLVDLDLGKEETKDEGESIIRTIRDKKVYSEIIFYSSNYEQLINKLNKKFVEGVFTSSREELVDKVQKVIYLTLKKVQDVNNLRGLIMAEVAELDILKQEIITIASQKFENKELERYALNKVKESGLNINKKAENHLTNIQNITFNSLFNDIALIDSNKKARIVQKALKKLNIEGNDFSGESYIDKILNTRNKFAHIKESDGLDEDGNKCKKIAEIPFTEKRCIEIRKEISKYKVILIDIKKQIE